LANTAKLGNNYSAGSCGSAMDKRRRTASVPLSFPLYFSTYINQLGQHARSNIMHPSFVSRKKKKRERE
jgi:hypothetical protein